MARDKRSVPTIDAFDDCSGVWTVRKGNTLPSRTVEQEGSSDKEQLIADLLKLKTPEPKKRDKVELTPEFVAKAPLPEPVRDRVIYWDSKTSGFGLFGPQGTQSGHGT